MTTGDTLGFDFMWRRHLAGHNEMARIFFVLPPQVHMLDLAGPLQVLNSLSELRMAPPTMITWRACSSAIRRLMCCLIGCWSTMGR